MKQTGIVISTSSDTAQVKIYRSSSCGGDCGSCGGCDGNNIMVVTTINSVNAQAGDTVEIEMPTKTVMLAAILTYVIPIISLIIGYLIGMNIFQKEFTTILFSISIMMLTFFVVSIYSKKNKEKYKLHITYILN